MLGWIGWIIAFYCTWQVGNRRRWAWIVNILAEIVLIWHGINIGDWSLVAAASLWAVLCVRNWLKWSPECPTSPNTDALISTSL